MVLTSTVEAMVMEAGEEVVAAMGALILEATMVEAAVTAVMEIMITEATLLEAAAIVEAMVVEAGMLQAMEAMEAMEAVEAVVEAVVVETLMGGSCLILFHPT